MKKNLAKHVFCGVLILLCSLEAAFAAVTNSSTRFIEVEVEVDSSVLELLSLNGIDTESINKRRIENALSKYFNDSLHRVFERIYVFFEYIHYTSYNAKSPLPAIDFVIRISKDAQVSKKHGYKLLGDPSDEKGKRKRVELLYHPDVFLNVFQNRGKVRPHFVDRVLYSTVVSLMETVSEHQVPSRHHRQDLQVNTMITRAHQEAAVLNRALKAYALSESGSLDRYLSRSGLSSSVKLQVAKFIERLRADKILPEPGGLDFALYLGVHRKVMQAMSSMIHAYKSAAIGRGYFLHQLERPFSKNFVLLPYLEDILYERQPVFSIDISARTCRALLR